jgi:hypothetical protein
LFYRSRISEILRSISYWEIYELRVAANYQHYKNLKIDEKTIFKKKFKAEKIAIKNIKDELRCKERLNSLSRELEEYKERELKLRLIFENKINVFLGRILDKERQLRLEYPNIHINEFVLQRQFLSLENIKHNAMEERHKILCKKILTVIDELEKTINFFLGDVLNQVYAETGRDLFCFERELIILFKSMFNEKSLYVDIDNYFYVRNKLFFDFNDKKLDYGERYKYVSKYRYIHTSPNFEFTLFRKENGYS